jgi:phospholipase C
MQNEKSQPTLNYFRLPITCAFFDNESGYFSKKSGAKQENVMRLSSRILFIAALIVTLAVGVWRVMPINRTYATSTKTVAKGTSTTPITHAVFIMLENHTFDNFFGSYTCPNADSNCDTVNGVTLPQATDPFPSDYNHGSEAAYAAINGGQMNGFEAHANYQYKQSDIPIYWYYAQHYGLGDKFFTSYATSSTPNHLAMFAAQSGGIFETTQQKGCTSPANDLVHSVDMNNTSIHYWQPPCVNIPTLDPSLTAAGLTWKFFCDVPIWCAPKMISSLYKSPNNVPDSQFIPDIYNKKTKACTLPNVSWVTPTGISTDHPPSLVEPAQNTLNDEVKAIMHSPCWNSTAVFVTWDDWGGEYDHVAPPSINSQGPGLGMRVPLLVISPYSKPGYVSHQLGEFSSFVKFVESDFSLPNLGARDALPAIGNLMDYFDFSQSPQPPPTNLPADFPTLNLDMLHVPSQGLGLGISGTLNPIIGGTNTQYTYSVVFTPSSTGITATSAQVIIDGTAYPMLNSGKTSGGGPGIPGGTLYTYTTTFSQVGIHSYSFSFTDSTGATQVLPHNGVPFRGPEVHSFTLNAATSPVTTSPTLPGKPVTYSVTYTSPSNTPPTKAQVIIDGASYPMQLTDKKPNYAKGAHYAFTAASLSPGVHYLLYQFDDSSNSSDLAVYPGRITPIVTPVLLSHSNASFSGNIATFQTTFSDISGNAPTQAFVYVDNTPHTMVCTPGCGSYLSPGTTFQYSMSISSGKHTYFFVFSDGQSSWGDPVGPTTYCINNLSVVSCTSGALINQASNQDDDPD